MMYNIIIFLALTVGAISAKWPVSPWLGPGAIGYSHGIYYNPWFDPDKHLIQICNETDFMGLCVVAPAMVGTSWNQDHDQTETCVSLPEDLESKFAKAYGDYETLSARTGTYIHCTAFEGFGCYGNHFIINSTGYSDASAIPSGRGFSDIRSFRCCEMRICEPIPKAHFTSRVFGSAANPVAASEST